MYTDFLDKYITPFKELSWVYNDDKGFIVWRQGTGNNSELLHIQTFKKRKGYGRDLFIEMLERLEYDPPYYSVFGFTRVDNQEAHNFYTALGFSLEKITGLYQAGECRLFWAPFTELVSLHIKKEEVNGPCIK